MRAFVRMNLKPIIRFLEIKQQSLTRAIAHNA
jgi:hypothetical protein